MHPVSFVLASFVLAMVVLVTLVLATFVVASLVFAMCVLAALATWPRPRSGETFGSLRENFTRVCFDHTAFSSTVT
jgi:hypothetical protein